MIRKTVIALAATALIGTASLTPASAHGMHGWGWGGIGLGVGLLGASIAYSAYPAYPAYDQSCWQYQPVVTPRGHVRNVLVNVCQ